MTLRERAAKALGCEPGAVAIYRPILSAWRAGRRSPYGPFPGAPFGEGATQAEAVADLERKAQARQGVKP